MYNRSLVPSGFVVPEGLAFGRCRMRMLTIDDVEKDYEAVIASRERLKGLLDPDSRWPEGLTQKENLIDLGWHQREFTLRNSFAYTVMAADEGLCLGCAYIFPSDAPDYDALVFYWVRAGFDADARDRELGRELRRWLVDAWPFRNIAFPGRDISWADFQRLKEAPSRFPD